MASRIRQLLAQGITDEHAKVIARQFVKARKRLEQGGAKDAISIEDDD
jgi:hypothetical protein